jgi:DNA-binding response OmpR family regulator
MKTFGGADGLGQDLIPTSSQPRTIGSDGVLGGRESRQAMRILVVEDEPRMADLLRRGLIEAGHAADAVHTGEDALAWRAAADYDALVLDLMLPDMDGVEVCRAVRQGGGQTPILLLTARDAVVDRVAGLDAGADDYLVKPFAFAELLARLRAITRRPPAVVEPILRGHGISLDPASRRVWRDGHEIALPNKEFRILEVLMRNRGRVLTRSMIAEHVWDYEFPGATNVIDVHVRQIRRKLADPYPGRAIETVRGAGYRFVAQS